MTFDPFSEGLGPWAERVRRGELDFTSTVENCLQRIEDEATLDAFECVDQARALATARAHDALLESGIDLGPLMGVPLGVKDIMAVNGFPTTNGSNADTEHLAGSEGEIIERFHRAGAIVIGKTRTVEFALGSTGVNESRGTPWNPADRAVHRIPGGSSSGSAVAVSAGLVGLGLGTDTGGSVRIPACLTGIVGHKTSTGLWPADGVFSLSTTLDSIGPLCRNVEDAATVHEMISGLRVPHRPSVSGLRFGIPHSLFLEDLDPEVETAFESAADQLVKHGAVRVDMDFPRVQEREELFSAIVPAELLSTLSPDYFQSIRGGMDSVSAARAAVGLSVTATDYLRAQKRRKVLAYQAHQTLMDIDCWLSPTCPFLPIPLDDLKDPAIAERALLASRNTQPGNLFDFCGISLPIPGNGLPIGLQVMMPHGDDVRLLSTASAIEGLLKHTMG